MVLAERLKASVGLRPNIKLASAGFRRVSVLEQASPVFAFRLCFRSLQFGRCASLRALLLQIEQQPTLVSHRSLQI